MTARHHSNSQNLVISFEYSWFLAKDLSNFRWENGENVWDLAFFMSMCWWHYSWKVAGVAGPCGPRWKSHWVQCPQGPATQMTPLCYNSSTLKTDHSPMLIDRVRKIESLWLYAMASVIHPQLSIVMIILYTHLLHESQKGFKCTKVIK